MKELSAGKYRHLRSLADENGIFKMIAVDQRPPIFQALAKHGNRAVSEVRYEEVADIKTLLTQVLAPECSAILVDPVWTHPRALQYIPGQTGLISTLEDYSFELKDGERWSYPIEGWSVKKIKRSGAAGVKLLAWHRPDVRPATQLHQDAFVQAVGEECRVRDIPFILELLIYPFVAEVPDSPEYAAKKPQLVLDSVRYYADERFGVDLLKLEFPADLKYCREFSAGAFDGRARESVYSLAEVETFLHDLHAVCNVPWVMLSAGVGPHEFSLNLELAFRAGASGFLAGRAVWLDALDSYPNLHEIERRLRKHSLPYLRQISAMADAATPWTMHPRYAGKVQLQAASEHWYKEYSL